MGRGQGRGGVSERQLAIVADTLDADVDAAALLETTEEQLLAEGTLHVVLDDAGQRSCAVLRIEASLGEQLPRRVVQLDHDVSLRELMTEGVFHEEVWGVGDVERPIWFFDLVGETIWGATARMLYELLLLVIGRTPPPALERWPGPGG